MLLLVRMTYGGCLVVNVPTSGTDTWNSARVSSSTASSASSARSTSSMSSTVGSGERIASSSGRAARNRSEKNTLSSALIRSTAVATSGVSAMTLPSFSRSIWV